MKTRRPKFQPIGSQLLKSQSGPMTEMDHGLGGEA